MLGKQRTGALYPSIREERADDTLLGPVKRNLPLSRTRGGALMPRGLPPAANIAFTGESSACFRDLAKRIGASLQLADKAGAWEGSQQ